MQINNQKDRDGTKRKRVRSTDSNEKVRSPNRTKLKKSTRTSDSEQKEDGEISDENDDSNDSIYEKRRNRRHSSDFPRKQIVYDVDDDDSYSSSCSGQNSPYNAYSGEKLVN